MAKENMKSASAKASAGGIKNTFSVMEEDVLEFWDKAKTFEKSVEKDAPQGDYVFYDGPPFITGLPHYATLLPSIAKDVVPRYWTMKGYRVERKWGWDCHGLPAENKVEKELELKNKKDIEKLGVDKFVGACRSYVNNVSGQWNWYINRIARWVDMDNAYRTMDKDFMESVIWSFKKLYDDGFIYEGYRSSLHCPRCATPLSKFEITMDAGSYKDVSDMSVVVKFKIKSKHTPSPSPSYAKASAGRQEGNRYILAWTTTPWTLPGNLALAVGEDIMYNEIRIPGDDNTYILAKERSSEIMKDKQFEIVKEFKGKELVGLEYEKLFDLDNKVINESKTAYKVYATDFVSTEDGTGIVHIAPNFGEDDFNVGKENDLPMVDIMDENGAYTKEAGEWADLYFKKAGKKVMEELGDRLFSSFEYTHSYPFCYRCDTPLIYKTQKAWYLDIDKIREKMLKTNENINWVPEHFKEGRFKYNLENAPHWCLSRSRYWGSPMPIWKCKKCDEIKVVGSVKEIEELSGEKIEDLHRPEIDKPEFKCSCGGKMKRIPEVMDCWFESGSMPFAQHHFPFEGEKDIKKIMPADFIIEYTGQLRGWFYYLHVLSNALFKSESFKNVIVTGVLAGTDGRKMSKSYGNYPDPKDTLDKYGGDALRMYFMNSPIMTGGDMSFNEKDLQEALRKNVMLLWNVYRFYDMFREDYIPTDKEPKSDNVLDQWILSRLNQLIKVVTENMEKYDMPQASRPITAFIDDLSTWYVRRSRDRFKGDDEADKKAALETTGHVLLKLSKTIAIFLPFIAEQVWQNVTGNNFEDENKSVHLESWPAFTKASADEAQLLGEMEVVRKIVELGLAKRDEVAIRVRQPLNQLTIFNLQSSIEGYEELIMDELNVKDVVSKEGKGDLEVELDTEITPELKAEGIKREVVRLVNGIRKNVGLTIEDSVNIYFEGGNGEIKSAIEKYKKDIIKDTLAKDLAEGVEDASDVKHVKIEGEEVKLGIKKI